MADKKTKPAKADKPKGEKKGKRDLEAVQESLHKVWLAGLGAVARAEEEGGKLFKTLVARGEDYERRGRGQVERLVTQVETGAGRARETASSTYERIEGRVDEMVSGALRRAGIPSREEIATLTRRVEELTRMVDGLKGAKPAPATSTSTSATPAAAAAPAAPKTAAKTSAKKPRTSTAKKA